MEGVVGDDHEAFIDNRVVNEVEPMMNNGNVEIEPVDAIEVEDIQTEEVLSEKEKEMEVLFIIELDNLNHCTMLQMERREKLPKIVLPDEIKDRANKILDMYLKNAETIPMITDIVHAMGKAVGYVLGINGQKGQK